MGLSPENRSLSNLVLVVGLLSTSCAQVPVSGVDRSDTTLQAAFQAAYGRASPWIDPDAEGCPPVVLEPSGMIDLGGGRFALVVDGTSEGGMAAHGCWGALSIHYLRKHDGRFQLLQSWREFTGGSSHGSAGAWRLRTDLFAQPAIQTEGGGVWQGYRCSYAHVVELTQTGPVERLGFHESADDDGAADPGKPDFVAELRAEKRDGPLLLRYIWDERREELIRLRRQGQVYRPEDPARSLPEGC